MDMYEIEEIKGRGYYSLIYPNVATDFSPVQDKSVWDASGSSISSDWIGEIKIRYQEVDQYSTSFFELKKYAALKAIAQELDLVIFYINVYADATLVYNISKMPIESYRVTNEYCPVSSAEDARGYTFKDMIHLPKEEVARKFNRGYRILKNN